MSLPQQRHVLILLLLMGFFSSLIVLVAIIKSESTWMTQIGQPSGSYPKLGIQVMPFGLNIVGVTYRRPVTSIFHDMLHHCHEEYMLMTLW